MLHVLDWFCFLFYLVGTYKQFQFRSIQKFKRTTWHLIAKLKTSINPKRNSSKRRNVIDDYSCKHQIPFVLPNLLHFCCCNCNYGKPGVASVLTTLHQLHIFTKILEGENFSGSFYIPRESIWLTLYLCHVTINSVVFWVGALFMVIAFEPHDVFLFWQI